MAETHPTEFAGASTAFGDGLARVCRLYGVSPLIGRLYAALFLSDRPMALDELCGATGAAKSTVSVALRKLLTLRGVRRLPPKGDRRDYYEAITDPWEMFADIVRTYLQPEADLWREASEALKLALETDAVGVAEPTRQILLERIEAMRCFADVFEALLASVQSSRPTRAAGRRVTIQLDPEEA